MSDIPEEYLTYYDDYFLKPGETIAEKKADTLSMPSMRYVDDRYMTWDYYHDEFPNIVIFNENVIYSHPLRYGRELIRLKINKYIHIPPPQVSQEDLINYYGEKLQEQKPYDTNSWKYWSSTKHAIKYEYFIEKAQALFDELMSAKIET